MIKTDEKNIEIGKKAESLKILKDNNFNLPEAFFISVKYYEEFISNNKELLPKLEGDNTPLVLIEEINLNKNLIAEITEFINSFAKEESFAVRSSGTMEDLMDNSFAGLYSSYLNQKNIDDIIQSVKYCWASAHSNRVKSYCEQNNIPFNNLKMGVIIQRMIETDVSGVAFSVNPLSGDDKEILIESCLGLGEGLVSGVITPSQYNYNWFAQSIVKKNIEPQENKIICIPEPPYTKLVEIAKTNENEEVLNDAEVEEVANVVLEIQKLYGRPVDVEWGIKDKKMYVFQSRPITKLSFAKYDQEWTTADFKDGGVSSTVCSPFMWSIYKMVWDYSLPDYLMKTKFLKANSGIIWGDMFFGRPYWNLSAVKRCVERLPGYNEREFDLDVGIEVTYEGDGKKTGFNPKSIFTGLKILNALKKSFNKALENAPEFKKLQLEKINQLDQLNYQEMAAPEFYTFYKKFMEEEYFLNEVSYFQFIFDNSNYNTLFKDDSKKIKGDFNYLNLISGLQNVSHIRPIQSLWELASKIKADKASKDYWINSSVPEITADIQNAVNTVHIEDFAAYIKTFKFHSTRELDITVPRYDEDFSFVIANLKEFLTQEEALSPIEKNEKQYQTYLTEIAKIKSNYSARKGAKIEEKVARLREFLWWREEYRDLSTKYYYYVRLFTLKIGELWVEEGLISDKNDIFFVELENILKKNDGILTSEDITSIIHKNKDYYNSFKNYENPAEIIPNVQIGVKKKHQNLSGLQGTPCSGGKYRGIARVIQDIYDSGRIEEGDILVTKFTDPGWTPKFKTIRGVITENGGVLSHAAVISREYGIPAVLAVKGAITIIKDGQEITIDGNTGEIELH